jgi:hypothetical protein
MHTLHARVCSRVCEQLASLLGVGSTKALLRCDFSRFMAQPFMQLHERWMKVRVRARAWVLACVRACVRACVCACVSLCVCEEEEVCAHSSCMWLRQQQ